MEENLTVSELAARIKYSTQTIYNFIYMKKFVMGIYYFKPTKNKILFVWSAVEKWLSSTDMDDNQENIVRTLNNKTSGNLINI